MTWLQSRIAEVKPDVVFAIVSLVVAFLVFIADLLNIPLPPWLSGRVPAATLLLLSTFVIAYFAHERRLSEHMEQTNEQIKRIDEREKMLVEYMAWKALGIQATYVSRQDTAQLDAYLQLLNDIRKHLFIVGITLKDVPHDHTPLLRLKAGMGCPLEFLMLAPEYWKNRDPVLDPVSAAMGGDLKQAFHQSITNLRALAKGVAKTGGKMEVRFYHQAPTLSLTAVDGGTHSGKMRVELTPHNSTGPDLEYFRPMLDLRRAGGGDLFSQFYDHYRALWDDSQAYIRVQDSRVWVNQTLDSEISGPDMLGLSLNWLPGRLQGGILQSQAPYSKDDENDEDD
jgi:hypothetical protein